MVLVLVTGNRNPEVRRVTHCLSLSGGWMWFARASELVYAFGHQLRLSSQFQDGTVKHLPVGVSDERQQDGTTKGRYTSVLWKNERITDGQTFCKIMESCWKIRHDSCYQSVIFYFVCDFWDWTRLDRLRAKRDSLFLTKSYCSRT